MIFWASIFLLIGYFLYRHLQHSAKQVQGIRDAVVSPKSDFTKISDVLAFVKEFNDKNKYFEESDLNWIAEIITANFRREPERGIDLLIRKRGDKISPDEVKALGFRRNKTIHAGYWHSLTKVGQEATDPSFELVAYVVKRLPSVQTENHKKMLEDSILAESVVAELITADDTVSHRTCSAAINLSRKKIPVKSAPFLPLKACDQACACAYVYSPAQDD